MFTKHYLFLCVMHNTTPSKEIAKAEAIRKEYFKNK